MLAAYFDLHVCGGGANDVDFLWRGEVVDHDIGSAVWTRLRLFLVLSKHPSSIYFYALDYEKTQVQIEL